MALGPNQFNGQAFGRPLSSPALVMFRAAALRVFCHPDVEGTIRAAENVAAVHSGQLESCPSASSGQSFHRTKTLEAGGVEPPSEEPNGQETTCLSRSLTAFASGPKERAITDRQLASIPPQRISPRIPRR